MNEKLLAHVQAMRDARDWVVNNAPNDMCGDDLVDWMVIHVPPMLRLDILRTFFELQKSHQI